MKTHLRFGMHRDIELIHSEADNIDGLVIPAHILSYQSASTSVFVTSMPGKPYIIDPMTFVFQNRADAILKDGTKMRPSMQKLCDDYKIEPPDTLFETYPYGHLATDDLGVCEDLTRSVIEFQLSKVASASETSAASKYLKRYGETKATLPRLLLPPYFCFQGTADEWYTLSLTCARKAAELRKDIKIAPVLCCPIEVLMNGESERVASDYATFDAAILWIDNLIQTDVVVGHAIAVRKWIKSLNDAGIGHLEALYGGYMMMLLGMEHLDAISQGILYTEHKSIKMTPGSGGAPERYYIPEFHEFRSLSQTDLILHKHPDLLCKCPVCREVLGDNPDNIIYFRDDPELLRKHFLSVRHEEANSIGDSSREEHAEMLRDTFKRYHTSISALPNPDSMRRASNMKGLDYLNAWADAITADID
jgi:hypothetical protein